MYFLSIYLEYLILKKNKICEDAGAISLVDKNACKDAVEQIKHYLPKTYFYSSSTNSDYPKGCYLYNNGNAVYFNPHENGARNKYAQPICKNFKGEEKQYNYTNLLQ